MKYHRFNCPETEQLFRLNELSEYDQLWDLESEWFEEPNYRRNGWSGVIKYPLKNTSGETTYVFIKRQENHNYKTLLHPIKGIPTFRREYNNIIRLNKKKIPTLSELYYGERIIKGKRQSILITQSLEDYQSFEEYFQPENKVSDEITSQIMRIAGMNTRSLHDANFRHGSLYPKHFFVKVEQDNIDVRFIDLEKLKWYPHKSLVRFNDMSRIIRHRGPISRQSIKILLDSYLSSGNDLKQSTIADKLYKLLDKQKDN